MIDVTMTVTIRPDVIVETLDSFMENMFHCVPTRGIINIDPVGYPDMTVRSVMNWVDFERYFVEMDHRWAIEADFSHAFIYCWNGVKADWAFHLEDDWELLRPVDIYDMMRILENNPKLASLRLPQFKSDADGMKNWNLWFPWNGEYFECPEELTVSQGFCGHPSLIKGEFVKKCAPLLNPELNPEKQFHGDNPELTEEVAKWRFGVYGKPNESNYIRDLGRSWMSENKLKKSGNKAWFKTWEKIKEGGEND